MDESAKGQVQTGLVLSFSHRSGLKDLSRLLMSMCSGKAEPLAVSLGSVACAGSITSIILHRPSAQFPGTMIMLFLEPVDDTNLPQR